MANAEVREAENDVNAAVAANRDVADAPSDNPRGPLALARLAIERRDFAAAQAALIEAERRGGDPERIAKRRAKLWRQTGEDESMRRAAVTHAADHAGTAADLQSLAAICLRANDLDGATTAARKALAIDPDHLPAVLLLVRCAERRGDIEEALALYRRADEIAGPDVRRALRIDRLLSMLGRIGEAAAVLADAVARWPDDPHLQLYVLRRSSVPHWPDVLDAIGPLADAAGPAERAVAEEAAALRKAISMAPRDDELRRILVQDGPDDVLIAPSAQGRPAVIVFTPATDCFGLPVGVFDRYLAALDVTAIYLRDYDRLLYLNGVRSLGDFATTQARLAAMVAATGASKLCTIGCSGGGLGAIRYGVDLGATDMVSFSGDTNRRRAGEIDRLQDGPLKAMALRLKERELGPRMDLMPTIRERVEPSRITLVYGEGHPSDREQALYLAECDGVTLHPLVGVEEHSSIKYLQQRPGLLASLRTWLNL